MNFVKINLQWLLLMKYQTNTNDEKEYEVYTRLDATLRTSHTYNKVDTAYTEYLQNGSTIKISYPFVETGSAQVFIINAGLEPSSFTTKYLMMMNLIT